MKWKWFVAGAFLTAMLALPVVATAEMLPVVTADFQYGGSYAYNGSTWTDNRVTNQVDAFTGKAGDGWDNAWVCFRQSDETAVRFQHQVLDTTPLGEDMGNYLRYRGYTSGNTRQMGIGRNYAGDGGIDPTKDHTLQFSIRYDASLTSTAFKNSTRVVRYVIHDRNMTGVDPNAAGDLMHSSTYGTWAIYLEGYSTTYGNAWSIRSSTLSGTAKGSTNTGIVPVTGTVYTFTLDFNVSGSTKTFDVDISSGGTSLWSDTGFGLSSTPTGGNGPTGWLNFANRTNTGYDCIFSLDEIRIAQIPEPTSVAMGLGLLLAGLMVRRRR